MVGHTLLRFDGTSRRLASPVLQNTPPTASQRSAIGYALYRIMKPIAIAVLRESSFSNNIGLILGTLVHGRKRLVWLLRFSSIKGHKYNMGAEILSTGPVGRLRLVPGAREDWGW